MLTIDQKTQIRKAIDSVLNGIQEPVNIPMIPIEEFEKILKENFQIDTDTLEEDVNGWQVDFWYYYKIKENIFLVLSGSLYYGKFNIFLEER